MLILETRENHITDYKSENSYWNKNDLVLNFLTIADTSENCYGQVQCFRTTSPLLGHPGATLKTSPVSSSTSTCSHVSRFVTWGISPASYLSTHLSSPRKQSGTGLCYPLKKKKRLFFYVDHFLKPLLNLLQYCFFFLFAFIGCKACGILRFEPASPLLEDKIFTTGLPGKSPYLSILKN